MMTRLRRLHRRSRGTSVPVLILAAAVLFLAPAAPAGALESRVATVDITVSLRPDGKATVFYRLEWVVSSGTLGGFYFQGESFDPVWDVQRCWADLSGGTRVGLDIKNLGGGRYDVLLAGGKRTSGTSFWNLTYGGDFAAADLVGRTTSAEFGDLVRFTWAPVEWDQALDSRTVRIVLPVVVSGPSLSEDDKRAIPLRTEKFVNQENRIDFYGSPGTDGRHYLSFLFFQEKVPARGSQELVLYLPAEYLVLDLPAGGAATESGGTAPAGGAGSEESYESRAWVGPREYWGARPWIALPVFGALTVLAILLYRRRLSAYERAAAVLEGIAWAGDAWTPPRLQEGSYQVPGKVAQDLHPVEAALLLELPLASVASIMLEGLKSQGLIEVLDPDPLRIRILSARKAESEYEELFLAAFDPEGYVLSGLMADFFEDAIKRLQEKIWDCDLEATRAFYRERLARAGREETEPGRAPAVRHAYDPYWHGYWMVHSRPTYYRTVRLPADLGTGYADFMRSASCFSGCFSPPDVGTVSACHSACHNACHDACHSACHSACHWACHSACHSACVSGGGH